MGDIGTVILQSAGLTGSHGKNLCKPVSGPPILGTAGSFLLTEKCTYFMTIILKKV